MNQKNKAYKKILACILSICLIATSGVFLKTSNVVDSNLVQAASEITVEPITLDPNNDYQEDVDMPYQWSYIDDTLITNDKISFKGYEDQGEIYLTAKNGLQSAKLYVNGVDIDISDVFSNPGQTYKVDISSITKSGTDNVIQLADFSPNTSLKADSPALNVKIPYTTVIKGTPEEVGMDQATLDLVDLMINNDVKYGFTAAQVAVIKDGKLVKNSAYGNKNSYSEDGNRLTDEEAKAYGGAVTTDTMFDLASNTKMYATNYAIEKLVTDGTISLDDKVSKYMGSDFSDASTVQYLKNKGYTGSETKLGKDDMTIQDILQHKAGFPADPKYQDNYYDPIKKTETTNSLANIYFSQDKSTTKKMICNTYLEYEPGTKNQYSDVDYMILGFIVEAATGQSLDKYVEENIYEPLGLTKTTYAPKENGFSSSDCAATELNGNTRGGAIKFNNIRDYTLQGEVHDEKAYYSMNQVSGHAGLFSTAEELAKLCQLMNSGGGNSTTSFFSQDVIDYFISPQLSNSTYGLGWRRMGDGEYAYYFGSQADSSTIGHTGWTGTLTVIDPSRDLDIVVLTNKINSPVTDPDVDPNQFDGEYFTSATYGAIATMIYDSMDAYEASDLADYDSQTSATLYQMTSEKLDLYDQETSGDAYKEDILKGAISLLDTTVTRAEKQRTVVSKDYAQNTLDMFVNRAKTDQLFAQYNDLFTQFQNRINAIDASEPILNVGLNNYTSGTWSNNDITISLQNENQQDTVYSYSTDGGNTFTDINGTTLTISTDTNADYIFKATSGNYSDTSKPYNIKLEKTQPNLNLNADTSTTAARQLVSMIPNVGLSGMDSMTVNENSGANTDITGSYTDGYYVTENGTYNFTLTSNAGNSATQSLTFQNIDAENVDDTSSTDATNDNNNSLTSGNSQKTGDDFNAIPYIIIAVIAAAIVIGLVLFSKKKSNNGNQQ